MKKKTRCGHCEGSRCERGKLPQRCWTCYGKGVEVLKTGPDLEESPCKSCEGSGWTIKHKCPACYGQGVVITNAVEKLKIRQFVEDGELLRFEHHGHEAPDSYNGDLFLTVFVEEHPVFTRDDCDLIVNIPVSYSTSILGGEVRIPQLDGTHFDLQVPKVEHKSQIVLKGQGLTHRKKGTTGKQVIVFHVTQGAEVSGEERALFERLQQMGM